MSRRERDLIVDQTIAQQPRLFRGLASSGVQAGAASWRWEVLEASISVQGSVDRVADAVQNSIGRIGTPRLDADGLMTVVGSGWRDLNTAVLTITSETGHAAEGVLLHVRSVSAEGLLNQHSATKAFDRFVADLGSEATVTIGSVSTSMQGRSGATPTPAKLRVAAAFGVILLWVASLLVRALGGGSLGWLAGGLFFAGLALGVASTVMAVRSRQSGSA